MPDDMPTPQSSIVLYQTEEGRTRISPEGARFDSPGQRPGNDSDFPNSSNRRLTEGKYPEIPDSSIGMQP
jgi:hypothetical protein